MENEDNWWTFGGVKKDPSREEDVARKKAEMALNEAKDVSDVIEMRCTL